MSDIIPLAACKDRHLYQVRTRNLLPICVFDAKRRGFIGVREKFRHLFLDEEFHFETGPPYGTARPIREVTPEPVRASLLMESMLPAVNLSALLNTSLPANALTTPDYRKLIQSKSQVLRDAATLTEPLMRASLQTGADLLEQVAQSLDIVFFAENYPLRELLDRFNEDFERARCQQPYCDALAEEDSERCAEHGGGGG